MSKKIIMAFLILIGQLNNIKIKLLKICTIHSLLEKEIVKVCMLRIHSSNLKGVFKA